MEYDIKHFNFCWNRIKTNQEIMESVSLVHSKWLNVEMRMHVENKEDVIITKTNTEGKNTLFVLYKYKCCFVCIWFFFQSFDSLAYFFCVCLAFVKHLKTLRPLSSWLEMLSYWFALIFYIILPSNFLPALVSFLFCFILNLVVVVVVFFLCYFFHFISSFVFVSTFFRWICAIFFRLSLIAFNERLKSLDVLIQSLSHSHFIWLNIHDILFYQFACILLYVQFYLSSMAILNPIFSRAIHYVNVRFLNNFEQRFLNVQWKYLNFGLDFLFFVFVRAIRTVDIRFNQYVHMTYKKKVLFHRSHNCL